MQINISGHHLDLTDPIRSYVNEKIEKLARHNDHITNVQVILSVDKVRQIAEATVSIPGGELFANAEEKDLYAAIDLLTDKLDRQLIKHKEKQNQHKHGSNVR